MTMTRILFGAAIVALAMAASPASAQLLGGSGGLGGGLGGTLRGAGGTLAGSGDGALGGTFGSTVDRFPSADTDTIARTRGSTRASKKVDARKGNVSASGATDSDTALDAVARTGRHQVTGSGSASGSAGGGIDAQLIGTDELGSAARNGTDRARTAADATAGRARNAAGGAIDRTRGRAGNAASRLPSLGNGISGAGKADGSGAGSLSVLGGNAAGAGNLALAGSGMADAGGFPVNPGMVVTNAKGRAIGTVQSVRSTASGKVQKILVRVGNKVAELPAANFTGSGGVLVSAMGKGDVKDAAQ